MVPVFMASTDMTVLFLAQPSIAADLRPSGTQQLWILHIGDFLTAGCLITMGRLTDRIGRRRLLTIGVAVYGVASALAAFSTTPEMLIVMRALLGVAAATIMPSGMALLRSMFVEPKQFSVAFAVFAGAFPAGAALGPPLGGLLLNNFWWGSVFLVNVPAAVLLVAAAPFLLPKHRDPSVGRLDPASIVLSMAAIMALIFGLQEMADKGAQPLYAAAAVLGAALAVAFVHRQKRLSDPLLDLRLFATSAVAFAVLASVLVMVTMAGTNMLLAQFLQVGAGFSPARSGTVMAVPAVVTMVGTMSAPVMVRFMRPAYAIASGLTIMASGYAILLVFVPAAVDGGVAPLIVGLTLMGLGVSATVLSGQIVVTSAPAERAGSAMAVSTVTGNLGNAMGVAFIGTLAMLVYKSVLSGTAPEGVAAADMQAAEGSAGGGATVAERLPGALGADMMEAVQAAFATATQTAYAVSLCIVVGVALMVLWRLRHVRLDSRPSEPFDPPEDGAAAESRPVPQPSGTGA